MRFNRELSWLSFNYRVLQEAKDPTVPLYERIKFLAIYSSNLDEFFRVRVASLRSLLSLKQKSQDQLKFDPAKLLSKIHSEVNKQQHEFGIIYREQIIPALQNENIFILNEDKLTSKQREFFIGYYEKNIKDLINPIFLDDDCIPFLKNRQLYIAVNYFSKSEETGELLERNAIIDIPTSFLPRFVVLPKDGDKYCISFIDDVIRINLKSILKCDKIVCVCSIKLNRDSDLNIDDEFSGNLLSKIKKGLKKRSHGVSTRFLYDSATSENFLEFLIDKLNLSKEDLSPGYKYHNYNDFFAFPNPTELNYSYRDLEILPSKLFDSSQNFFNSLSQQPELLNFPYQSYEYVIDLFKYAATDPKVKSIKLTQYRVADNSEIIKALIQAAKNGKEVIVFVELKARFDEEMNIKWAEEMQQNGVKVFYSFPGLKVHAKIGLITRTENGVENYYSYLATGNFNEKTARVYSDFGYFSKDQNIGKELQKLFEFLVGNNIKFKFNKLLIAQFNLRKCLSQFIKNEIEFAQEGKPAKIILKMNSLEDKKIINLLYLASKAGVKIQIIVRGICCLIPGLPDESENISIISIVDKYLEHSRVFIFNNGGNERVYLSSADLMSRNLNRRIEAAFPIEDERLKRKIIDLIKIQLEDNSKARIIDKNNLNQYKIAKGAKKVRAQMETYNYLKTHS